MKKLLQQSPDLFFADFQNGAGALITNSAEIHQTSKSGNKMSIFVFPLLVFLDFLKIITAAKLRQKPSTNTHKNNNCNY